MRKNSKVYKAVLSFVIVFSLLISPNYILISKAAANSGDGISSLSHPGYTLEQVIVLSRHNIRSPLSGNGSVLDKVTPHKWYNWSSKPSELSLRGGVLETIMGQYFRKWLEAENFIQENYRPVGDEVRVYANSKQRTIATAQYFISGMLPTANVPVEYHAKFDTMDSTFNPVLTYCSDEYIADATNQIKALYADDITKLNDNYRLLEDVIDYDKSEGYTSGEYNSLVTNDSVFKLEIGAEPAVSGSLKTACSISDALVLQYYEEGNTKKAGFGKTLSGKKWEAISEIKDVYGDVLFSAPLISTNVSNPLLKEIYSEMNHDGRKFTFLCGHDSNLASVLSALNVAEYELPNTIEKKTPIGCKLVFSKWRSSDNNVFWSIDMVYQSTEQLRNISLLDVMTPPAIYHLRFQELEDNQDGLYKEQDIKKLFEDKINLYDVLYQLYVNDAA